MQDEKKTKSELLQELRAIRARLSSVEEKTYTNAQREDTISVPKEILLNNLKELVVHESKDMRILWANRAACERGKATIDEIVGRYCYEVWAERTVPCPDCPVVNAMKTGKAHEKEVIARDGSAWIIHGYPLLDSKGNITSGMEIALDITDRKKAEKKLEEYRNHLEELVESRTIELSKINEQLIKEMAERVNIERELKKSEEKYRTIFETTGAATVIIEEDMKISLANKEFEKLSGFRRDEAEGKAWTEFVSAQDQTRLKEYHYIKRLTPDAVPQTYEFTFIDRHQNAREVLQIMSLISGTTQRVASFLDITEQKHLNKALEESESRFRALVEQSLVGIYLADDHEFLYVNEAFANIFGYQRDELIGIIRPEELIHHEDRSMSSDYSSLLSMNEMGFPASVFRGLRKDGTIIFCEVFRRPIKRDDRSVVIGTLVNITKRKKAEETLKESERRLSDIINFLPDATFAIDSEGTVIAWNYAIEEMTGVKAADMLGKGDYEYAIPLYGYRRPILIDLILKPDKEIEEKYVFLRKEKDVLIVKTDAATLQGKPVYMWGKASPIYDLNGNMVGAIESTRDITEQKLVEDALKKRERELEEKSRYLEEANTALKVLLEQREKDKKELEENVLINVEKSLLPYLEKLKKTHSPTDRTTYLDILESSVNSIVSPFYRNMTLKHFNLTPKEIEIATLIKEGNSTKEIAELLTLSPRTIDLHRLNIRRKLGLKAKGINLRSTLLSYS